MSKTEPEKSGSTVNPEADLQTRIEGLNSELPTLLGKYELALSAVAGLSGDGRVEARPIVVSSRGRKIDDVAEKKSAALDEG